MQDRRQPEAWLETPDGVEAPIHGACFIGRGNVNTLVLHDNRVSARHAMIHSSAPGEYWLIDLGSRNGTYVNGRPASQPVRLADRDHLEFPGCRLVFRQASKGVNPETTTLTAEKTLQEIKNLDCWLLVADIEAYTLFLQRSTPVEVAHVTGHWLATCKRLIEAKRGIVNKTLGDGFLAYWPDQPGTPAQVATTLHDLKQIQAQETPRFRVVVHYGKVYVGGGSTPGEESLLGAEVNFVFRMEKLASNLGRANLVSREAKSRLHLHLSAGEECRQSVAGFQGDFAFYSF